MPPTRPLTSERDEPGPDASEGHEAAPLEPPGDEPEGSSSGDDEPSRDVASRGPNRWWLLAASCLAGLLAAAASFKLRTGLVPTDPWHYVVAGLTFPAESWNDVGMTRYGMILPMIPITRLFHQSELSFYLLPCVMTGILVAGVYWLAGRFYGFVAGIAAAVLILANSVVLVNASRLYPDVAATAMTILAVVFAVASRDLWATRRRVTASLVLALVATGLMIGLSWWMRETVIFAWPVVVAVLLWRGRPPLKLSVPLVAVPAAALLGVEMLISRWAFGDAFLRFEALTSGNLSDTTNQADLPYLGQSRFSYLSLMPKDALTLPDGHWMIAMGIVAIVAGLVFPRRVGLFAGWFAFVFLAFALMGGGLRPDAPNIRLDVVRYWVAYLPPMVIAAVGGVTVLLGLIARRVHLGRTVGTVAAVVVALALVTGPVLASAHGVRGNSAYVMNTDNAPAQFRNWLHTHDREVRRVYTDWQSGRVLPTYDRSFSGHRMAHTKWLSITGHRPKVGSYVVLYSAYNYSCFFCHETMNQGWLPLHQEDLKRWPKVWQSTDGTFIVYKVTTPPHRDGT